MQSHLMREFNFATTLVFALLYVITVTVFGATDTITCVDIDGAICAGSDRIVTELSTVVLLSIPLLILATIHTISYLFNKRD